jgi:hypothetical protein
MRRAVVLGGFVLLLALSAAMTYASYLALRDEPLRPDAVAGEDGVVTVYTQYASDAQSIDDRPIYGATDRPVTIILTVRPGTPETSAYLESVVPEIIARYGARARIAFAYEIAEADAAARTGSYRYAIAARCLEERQGTDAVPIEGLLALSRTDVASIDAFLTARSLACPAGFPSIASDAFRSVVRPAQAPSAAIGIMGRDPAIVYGDPSWTVFDRRVREKEVTVGI